MLVLALELRRRDRTELAIHRSLTLRDERGASRKMS